MADVQKSQESGEAAIVRREGSQPHAGSRAEYEVSTSFVVLEIIAIRKKQAENSPHKHHRHISRQY